MRFIRFQSGDISEQFLIPSVQGKESSLLWFSFHLISDRFPMVQQNVPNRSSVSQTQTQTAIVCLQMICLTRSIRFFLILFFPRLSSFLVFMCLWLPHSHSYVFILSVIFSPFPSFSLQGGHMVDRQTEGAEISLKRTQSHDGQCMTKTLDQTETHKE